MSEISAVRIEDIQMPSMPSDQTRSAILAAAERLYADRGFGDVTLRDIVAEANVNLAAVNYHFGSKDELIAELFVTRSLATNRERLNELKAAEEKGGGRAPIDAILHAIDFLGQRLNLIRLLSPAGRRYLWLCSFAALADGDPLGSTPSR